jgi:hypothetical protein
MYLECLRRTDYLMDHCLLMDHCHYSMDENQNLMVAPYYIYFCGEEFLSCYSLMIFRKKKNRNDAKTREMRNFRNEEALVFFHSTTKYTFNCKFFFYMFLNQPRLVFFFYCIFSTCYCVWTFRGTFICTH